MGLLQDIVLETARMLLLAAPFFLLGLLLAGFLHVLVPEGLILRWMGGRGLGAVAKAALLGVPLPVCSCGVVPIAVELRRKGASRPASLSFLTTTPESSVDSILLTWGLMGPVMALARPVAAFFSAMLGGVLSIAWLEGDARQDAGSPEAPTPSAPHSHEHDDGCDHSQLAHAGAPEAWRILRRSLAHALTLRWLRRRREAPQPGPGLWQGVVRPALRYGFIDLLDDLAFWLVLGVLLAGLLGALAPADLGALGLGGGLTPMLLMLVVGIPLYMCASASTPVAAALMAKGLSPGAALVFLLSGPATNAATLVLLGRTFGRAFVRIYLLSIAAGALLAGLMLEWLLAITGWQLVLPLAGELPPAFEISGLLSLVVLLPLLVWRLWRGAARQGWREMVESLQGLVPAERLARLRGGEGRRRLRRWLLGVVAAAVLLYLLMGLTVVPPDSRGYGFVFGALVAEDRPPGLHYLAPPPFGRWEVRRVEYARKADVGFRTDLDLFARRKETARYADPAQWHSAVAAMNVRPAQATYLTADENLLEISFTVHYRLAEPASFFYGLDHSQDLVGLYAEAAARQLVAGRTLEQLLTERRQELEAGVAADLGSRLAALGTGVEVVSVHVVDLHPPAEAVFAFRDVSSAREDRETRIHRAWETLAGLEPRTRGEAALLLAEAEAEAATATTEAAGRAQAFRDEASAVAGERRLLRHLLWLEAQERLLAGRPKVVLPPGSAAGGSEGGRGITLWRTAPQKEME